MKISTSNLNTILCYLVPNSNHVEVELSFALKDLLKVEGDMRGLQIVCKSGKFWITQFDDQEDYTLQAGECFVVTNPRSILIQSVNEGLIQLISRYTFWITSHRKISNTYPQPWPRISNWPLLRRLYVLSQQISFFRELQT